MPKSLRSKLKHLNYKEEINDREYDRLMEALDQYDASKAIAVYICDKKACDECSGICEHTTDIKHAVNFEPIRFINGKVIEYVEKHDRTSRWIFFCHQNYICECCHYLVADSDIREYKYCPKCGARMEGTKNERS